MHTRLNEDTKFALVGLSFIAFAASAIYFMGGGWIGIAVLIVVLLLIGGMACI